MEQMVNVFLFGKKYEVPASLTILLGGAYLLVRKVISWRIPVAYLVSRLPGVSLFEIGLATPASSLVQICLCVLMFVWLERRRRMAQGSSLRS